MKGCRACIAKNVEIDGANVYFDDGGSYTQFCETCRDVLEKRHDVFQENICVFCAEPADPDRADGMEFMDEPGPEIGRRFHICDDCRFLTMEEGEKVQVVLI